MLISLNKIITNYKLNIRGVIHIGAHHGQEYPYYEENGIENMMFFEPVRDNYEKLLENLPKKKGIKTYNLALGNEVGVKEMYIEQTKGQSCSFLAPETHLELHPHIKFTGMEEVGIVKLDCVSFDHTLYNMINIDVQGYELEVFKGSKETLKTIDIVYTEVNFEEVYKNCCKVEELDKFLGEFGFIRVWTKDCGIRRGRKTWGDALYLKRIEVINFDQSIKSSYTFNQQDYEKDKIRWGLLKELYQRNFVEDNGNRNYNTLPRRIHQIWLGSKPLSWHTKLAESWKKFNPEWEYRLWRDDDVDSILEDRTLYDSMKNLGQESDYLRYNILEKFGGIYADTDFECLKSFNALGYADFIAGVGYPMKVELYNAFIACTPHHPIIKKMLASIKEVGQDTSISVFKTTGTYLLTNVFFDVITKPMDGVLVLPTEYFSPYPNHPGFEVEKGRKYIKDCSYGIHYWEILWIKQHRHIIEGRKQVRKY